MISAKPFGTILIIVFHSIILQIQILNAHVFVFGLFKTNQNPQHPKSNHSSFISFCVDFLAKLVYVPIRWRLEIQLCRCSPKWQSNHSFQSISTDRYLVCLLYVLIRTLYIQFKIHLISHDAKCWGCCFDGLWIIIEMKLVGCLSIIYGTW